jgi:hypothetical protein
MQSGKVLIMPNKPQTSSVPAEDEGPVFGPGPISASDIRTLYTVIDIQRTLGRLEHAIQGLEKANVSHGEKLQQVVRQTDRSEFALSILDKAIALHGQRIQRLEKEVFVAEVFVAGGGLAALAVYLIHRLAPFFSK